MYRLKHEAELWEDQVAVYKAVINMAEISGDVMTASRAKDGLKIAQLELKRIETEIAQAQVHDTKARDEGERWR